MLAAKAIEGLIHQPNDIVSQAVVRDPSLNGENITETDRHHLTNLASRNDVLESPSPDCEVEKTVQDFLHEIDGFISQVVAGDITIPKWSLLNVDMAPADSDHLTNLGIPALKNKPSLLLHNLGHFINNPDLKERLENIFMTGYHTWVPLALPPMQNLTAHPSFFFNTPGSGKTRLLLEGLCQNWGFYFTSSVNPSQLGSVDIQRSIRRAESMDCTDVHRTLRLVFLARLIIFTSFAGKMDPHSFLADYRKRWLILQVLPQPGHPKTLDVFDELAVQLSTAPDDWVASSSETYLRRVHDLITSGGQGVRERTPLFCVLDEAQFAATPLINRYSSFSSNQEDDERTMLGELLRVWEEQSYGKFVDVFMVVTGTGTSKERVESAMKSAIMKKDMYRGHTDTGAFSTAKAQRHYLDLYLPRSLIKSDSGKRLLNRLWYWLRGRYRFTAGYVEELIQNGFR